MKKTIKILLVSLICMIVLFGCEISGGYEINAIVKPQDTPILLVRAATATEKDLYIKYPSGEPEKMVGEKQYINRIIEYFPSTNEVFFEGSNNEMKLLSISSNPSIKELGKIYSIIPLESYGDERYIYITLNGLFYNNGSKIRKITSKKLSTSAPHQAKEVYLDNVIYLEENNTLKLSSNKDNEVVLAENVTDFNVIGKDNDIVYTDEENNLYYYNKENRKEVLIDKFDSRELADAALSVGMDSNNGRIVYTKQVNASERELYIYIIGENKKSKIAGYSGNGEAFIYDKWVYLYNGEGIQAINLEDASNNEIIKSNNLKLYKLKDRGIVFSYEKGIIYELNNGVAKELKDNIKDILVYKDKIVSKDKNDNLCIDDEKIDDEVGSFSIYNNLAVYVRNGEIYNYDTEEDVKHKYSNISEEYEVYFLKNKLE